MAESIIAVGGSKGGVGKSTVASAVAHRCLKAGKDVLLVETDTSNPDVYNAYSREIQCRLLDLDGPNGWMELVNLCEKEPNKLVVVNTAARNNRGIEAYAETLRGSLAELRRRLITLWVINAESDSVALLKTYMEVLPDSEIHVVRNLYFGTEVDFFYEKSQTKGRVEAKGGRSVNFPVLASRLANDIRTHQYSLEKAFRVMPLGHRAELRRWYNLVERALDQVVPA